MARMREKTIAVTCPLCNGVHETRAAWWLRPMWHAWLGYQTYIHCDVRAQGIYKLYDETYHYVCWQQNLRDDIPDYEDIPF